MILYRAVDTQG